LVESWHEERFYLVQISLLTYSGETKPDGKRIRESPLLGNGGEYVLEVRHALALRVPAQVIVVLPAVSQYREDGVTVLDEVVADLSQEVRAVLELD